MAYTEKYVTSAAGGGGDGSLGNPWTLTEAFANAVAGDRVNIQSDAGYNIAGGTISNAGTVTSYVCFRGYNSIIGDLENQGRNSNTTLNTSNFPTITTSALITPSAYSLFQNLIITGSVSGALLSSTSIDFVSIVSCKIENTLNNTAARAVILDNGASFINCDIVSEQTSHNILIQADARTYIDSCRIKGTSSTATLVSIPDGIASSSAFMGGASAIGLLLEQMTGAFQVVSNCTFYGLGVAISTPNSAQTEPLYLKNNHVTDCGTYLDNLYQATANHNSLEMNTRTRDNTTSRVAWGEGVISGEVTTDTGGPETDYVDAPNGDITLIPAAPAVDAGLGM